MPGLDMACETVVDALVAIHGELTAAPDLRPGPRVDAVFRRLVGLVVDGDEHGAAWVLDHPSVRQVAGSLRARCLEGEYELEAVWAQRIAGAPVPAEELERFPYAGNYRALSALESEAVARLAGAREPVVRRAAFVGSGPLPVTAFLLAERGVRVDCIERDPQAADLSRRAAAALGIDGLAVVRSEVAAAPTEAGVEGGDPRVDLAAYDLVVLAATVGSTPERKAGVIAHLAGAMAPGALLVARSARGLRTLLYPEIDPATLDGFTVLGIVHPTGDVINSVIVARAQGGA
jgi:nicotianamine synthase-like protein